MSQPIANEIDALDALDALINRHGPACVASALTPLLSDERIARIERVLDARLQSVTVALENLHDPHNGAAVVRSIEALGLTPHHRLTFTGLQFELDL